MDANIPVQRTIPSPCVAAVQQLIRDMENVEVENSRVAGLDLLFILPKLLWPNEERNASLKDR
eukprot:1548167-Amphidinium_carterae.2